MNEDYFVVRVVVCSTSELKKESSINDAHSHLGTWIHLDSNGMVALMAFAAGMPKLGFNKLIYSHMNTYILA